MFAVPENTIALPESAAHVARHPVRIARDYALDRDRWRTLLRYDPDERFAALIDRIDGDEVWLLSWLPGQHTGLHDHGTATGAFTVVSGKLTETVARRAVDGTAFGSAADTAVGVAERGADGRAATQVHTLGEGQSRVFGPGYAHDVLNEGPDPAISVHVYRAEGRTVRPVRADALIGSVAEPG
ncbi:putative metal-dependent enzyme (double-stranded beta helix superfamily) [Prauserella isguenensis]|uniref:Putative metal-dependent enzyme (Double-stranded beta helix superfamily) n=1 Tax=Prauserella isguenensis TaxID=1470180 RepID=A0A839S3G9_9PSEU|nr:cysteine dioxygenase family protein [Prauserella isguenensis]MBB3052318.1 putative metal-dependent enzyme (double-stranded beta helix superfamily) [Prauserella isguenensis]